LAKNAHNFLILNEINFSESFPISILLPSKGKSHAQEQLVKRLEALSGIWRRGVLRFLSFACQLYSALA